MTVVFNPWIANPSNPTPVPVGVITYTLWLRFTPHLITPETIPDQAKRRLIICGQKASTCSYDNGIVLELGFYALTRGDTGELKDPLNYESGGCGSFVE
jgi:hypothetical protein